MENNNTYCMHKNCKKPSVVSTPSWVYLISFMVSLILFLCHCDLSTNISVGLISSTTLALLIDIANTHIQRKKELEIYEFLNKDLKEKCLDLLSDLYISVYECYGYLLEGKRSFESWLYMLMDMSRFYGDNERNEQLRNIKFLVQAISEIKKSAYKCKELVSPELDNPYFDENYVELLKKLSKCCSNIETLEKLGKYEECKNKINVDLKNDILEIFPDLKERFTQEYDEHDFEEN